LIRFVIAAAVVALLTPVAAKLFASLRVVAVPSELRWHQGALIPRSGGIAIYLAVIFIALAIPWQWQVALTMFFLAGLRDDVKPLSIIGKLISQSVAAVIAVTSLVVFPGEVLVGLMAVIWVAFFVNAYNMLDNMDGTAAATAFVISLTLAVIAWEVKDEAASILACALAGAMLGFWFFNVSPARVFLGDNGSHFVGAALAIIALSMWQQVGATIMIAFAVPIIDFFYVTLKRLAAGRKPYVGGRDHLAHDLHRLGFSPRLIAGFYLLGNAIYGLIAWSASR
jgi:UDP-GlcNAc:undecaprenyl-phosphate/decaprenyl-phosphate GlcNAc-1-phosphate transferase